VGRGGGPFLDDEPLTDVEVAGRELDVGPGLEDRADVGAHVLAPSPTRRRVWLSKTMPGACMATIRVEVVGVPAVVVAADRRGQRLL